MTDATKMLREEEAPFGITVNEAVCRRCHLIANVHTMHDGICRDCEGR